MAGTWCRRKRTLEALRRLFELYLWSGWGSYSKKIALTERAFSHHAGNVSDSERMRYWRKTLSQEPTPFVVALRLARRGRTRLALAVLLDVPYGTLNTWLTYPPRRSTPAIRRASERLTIMGFLCDHQRN